MKTNSLKEIKNLLYSKVCTTAPGQNVRYSSRMVVSEGKRRFFPAIEMRVNRIVSDVPQRKSFNREIADKYIIGGYRFSEMRKREINTPRKTANPWERIPAHIQEQHSNWAIDKFFNTIFK